MALYLYIMEENSWSLDDMKQTLSLLKKALLSEREERKQVKSDLAEISILITNTEKNLKDKVHATQILSIERLDLVNQDLEYQIKNKRLLENLSETTAPLITTDSRGFFILEQQNQKLEEEILTAKTDSELLLKNCSKMEK